MAECWWCRFDPRGHKPFGECAWCHEGVGPHDHETDPYDPERIYHLSCITESRMVRRIREATGCTREGALDVLAAQRTSGTPDGGRWAKRVQVNNGVALATIDVVLADPSASRDEVREVIAGFRGVGLTWQALAVHLGVSRQAAWERFH